MFEAPFSFDAESGNTQEYGITIIKWRSYDGIERIMAASNGDAKLFLPGLYTNALV
jgi:hypothetical protein